MYSINTTVIKAKLYLSSPRLIAVVAISYTSHQYLLHQRLISMGKCMSRLSVYDDMDATLLRHARSHDQDGANRFRHAEGHRFHNEKNCPYPLPNDLTEIDR